MLPSNNVFRVVPEPDDNYILAGAGTPAANSTGHKVNPVEKAAGFEIILAITAILVCRCCSCRGKT